MNREHKKRLFEKGYYKTHPCNDKLICKLSDRMIALAEVSEGGGYAAFFQIKAALYLNSTNTSLSTAEKSVIIISTKALLNLIRSDNNDNWSNYKTA